MKFKKLSNGSTVDLISYVSNYLDINENIDILIGCDSQNYREKTLYATVVALYNRGRGAHLIFKKEITPVEPTRQIRLMNEVWKSIEVAEFIRKNGLPRAKYIDIDLNPDSKYKSNEVLRSAVGLVEGMGYSVRYKTMGLAVTYAADMLVK
jgi:uncharacterized protein